MLPHPRIAVYRDHAPDGSLCWRGEVNVYGGTCCEIVLYATTLRENEAVARGEAGVWLREYLENRKER